MELQVVAIFDHALQAYGRPIFVAATGQALRSFIDEINTDGPDNGMFKHPEDFDLYHLASYDDASGAFSSIEPSILARGKEVKYTVN